MLPPKATRSSEEGEGGNNVQRMHFSFAAAVTKRAMNSEGNNTQGRTEREEERGRLASKRDTGQFQSRQRHANEMLTEDSEEKFFLL